MLDGKRLIADLQADLDSRRGDIASLGPPMELTGQDRYSYCAQLGVVHYLEILLKQITDGEYEKSTP